jgi:hypothetical protein
MAMIAFHFSGSYRKAIFSGAKTCTVMKGETAFKQGQEVLLYISQTERLFDGRLDERVGKGIIEEVRVKKVGELTQKDALESGHRNLAHLKEVMKDAYGFGDDGIVSFIRFRAVFE